MPNVVSFSGGRTSAYLVWEIEQRRKAGKIDDVHYVFMDTGAEHPKTYEFIRNVVKYFGIDLVCLRANVIQEQGKSATYHVVSLEDCKPDLIPWYDYTKKYGMPHVTMPKCTDVMKIMPFKKWCIDQFGKDNYTTWLGIRIDEPKRLKDVPNMRYLAELSVKDKQDINDWWHDQPFDLGLPDYLGNCVFCIKKGANRIALGQRDEPYLADQWRDMVYRDGMHITAGRREAGIPNEACYRNYQTFNGITEAFEDNTRDELLRTLRSASGACEESCEVFNCQLDMFD